MAIKRVIIDSFKVENNRVPIYDNINECNKCKTWNLVDAKKCINCKENLEE